MAKKQAKAHKRYVYKEKNTGVRVVRDESKGESPCDPGEPGPNGGDLKLISVCDCDQPTGE